MKRSIELKRKWIPFALIPMMSVAVLAGCSSDDDDTDDGTVIVDGNGDGSDGDGGDGSDGDGGDVVSGDGIGTGDLDPVGIEGDLGTVNFSWDGFNLSGTVSTNADAGATSAALYQGIAASNDAGMQLIELSGSGPDFTYPNGLSSDQSAPIAAQIAAGNLFVRIQTASGPVDSFQLLPPSRAVVATYTTLSTNDSSVSSSGDAFMNVNTISGDYSIYLSVNIDERDTDEDGNTVTLSAAHVHAESASGPVIVPLSDTGSSEQFSATGQMNADQLSVVTSNNAWFNVHLNDGNTPGASFLTGQISSEEF